MKKENQGLIVQRAIDWSPPSTSALRRGIIEGGSPVRVLDRWNQSLEGTFGVKIAARKCSESEILSHIVWSTLVVKFRLIMYMVLKSNTNIV